MECVTTKKYTCWPEYLAQHFSSSGISVFRRMFSRGQNCIRKPARNMHKDWNKHRLYYDKGQNIEIKTKKKQFESILFQKFHRNRESMSNRKKIFMDTRNVRIKTMEESFDVQNSVRFYCYLFWMCSIAALSWTTNRCSTVIDSFMDVFTTLR